MAELTESADAPTSTCCTPEQQVDCCEPSDKAECCEAECSSCGCSAGQSKGEVSITETHRVHDSAASAIIRARKPS